MARTFLHRITLPLVGFLGALAIRCIRRLVRLRRVNRETVDRLVASGERTILAFWHDQLFLMPYVYPWGGTRVSILISRHRDGEYISRPLQAMGFDTTRGSSSSGGASSLRAMMRKLRAGFHLAITPDGPRGPRHKVQAGVIQAARLTGAWIAAGSVPYDCAIRPFQPAETGRPEAVAPGNP